MPPAEFSKHAHIKSLDEYERIYKESVDDPDKFWARIASELHWFKKWDKVLEWNCPWAKWFVGGEINLSYNCLDRHVTTWRKNKAAIIWESEPGEVRILTYQQLHREVQKFANVLKALGVKKGDRVAIYMGMTPELPIAMLACARIGAPHTVVFGGFSSNALVDRIHDSQATVRHHARRIVPPRRRSETVSRGRRSAEVLPEREARRRLQAHRHCHQHAGRPRSLVARADGQGLRRVPGRAARRRAPALHPLHLRHHRQTQRRRAHHRRIFRRHLSHHQVGLRSERRRHLLVYRRHRMGHRPQLHRLRPAAERRHQPDVRRRAELPRARPLLVDHRAPQSQHLLHRAHRHPHLHQVGRRVAEEA